MPCRHCGPDRRLCTAYYDDPLIRDNIRSGPRENGCYDTDVDDFDGPAELPDTPTDALPGTEGKIAVLAQRAAQWRQLWHPDDRA